MIEMMTTVTCLGMLMIGSVAVFKHSVMSSVRLEAVQNLKNFSQLSVNSIRQHVAQSRVIFQNDAYGTALWNRLTFDTGWTPISTTKLPTINETGSLSPSMLGDADSPFDPATVGNAMFFMESEGHADVGGRWIDLYRPRAYYICKYTSTKLQDKAYAYDIVEWIGNSYADKNQLVGAPVGVYTALLARGINQAWDCLATDVNATVYSVNSDGTTTAQAGPSIAPSYKGSATHLFGTRESSHYAVAFNSDASYPLPDTVPAYATGSNSGDGFPNGFEAAVVGPTGGRKALIRLVMVAEGYGGRYSSASMVLASARNF